MKIQLGIPTGILRKLLLNLIKDYSNFLEIGPGSGRLADTILSIFNNTKYVICDVPLALYVSYFRLKKRF